MTMPKWYKAMNKRQHTLLPMWPGFTILGGLFYEDLLIPDSLTVYENGLVDYYTGNQSSFNASKALSNRVRDNPEFWREYDQKVYPLGQKNRSRLLEIGSESFDSLSDSELLGGFDELIEMLKLQGGTLTLARIVALREIDELLHQKLADPQKIQRAHAVLRTPVRPSWPQVEILEFQRLVVKARKESLVLKAVRGLLERHQYRFGWLSTDLHYGVPLSVEELQQRFEEEIAGSPKEKLLELGQLHKQSLDEQAELVAELKPSEYLRGLMHVLSFEIWLKTYRRYSTTQIIFYGLSLFEEIANRARIELENLWWATPPEIREFLVFGKPLREDTLQERRRFMVMITADGENTILLGDAARKLLAQEVEPESVEYSKVLKGVPANAGKADGKAKVIMDHSRVEEIIKQGDVIVATQAPPSFIRAIRRCVALVVEEGAITSHASILAREFGKPCIVGVQGATTIIKTGDELKVNADEGVVEIL